eukprot:8272394-Alexandrium_andersonii.AAC.1
MLARALSQRLELLAVLRQFDARSGFARKLIRLPRSAQTCLTLKRFDHNRAMRAERTFSLPKAARGEVSARA